MPARRRLCNGRRSAAFAMQGLDHSTICSEFGVYSDIWGNRFTGLPFDLLVIKS